MFRLFYRSFFLFFGFVCLFCIIAGFVNRLKVSQGVSRLYVKPLSSHSSLQSCAFQSRDVSTSSVKFPSGNVPGKNNLYGKATAAGEILRGGVRSLNTTLFALLAKRFPVHFSIHCFLYTPTTTDCHCFFSFEFRIIFKADC